MLVLDGVNLVVEPGDHIAITGPSGGGKSTLVKILLGLVEPDGGQLLIDGMPLERFGHKSYREQTAPAQIGWVLPADDGELVAGLQDGVYRFSPDRAEFTLLAEPERPGNRLNDAATDSQGPIWFGSMDDGETDATGKVYLFDKGRISETGIAPVAITNGPAVSPDGLWFDVHDRNDGSRGAGLVSTGPGVRIDGSLLSLEVEAALPVKRRRDSSDDHSPLMNIEVSANF